MGINLRLSILKADFLQRGGAAAGEGICTILSFAIAWQEIYVWIESY